MFLIHLVSGGVERIRFSSVPLSTKEMTRVLLFGYCYGLNRFMQDEFWLKHYIREEV